jgi:hypothetical protein
LGRQKFFQPQVGREEKSLGTYVLDYICLKKINGSSIEVIFECEKNSRNSGNKLKT